MKILGTGGKVWVRKLDLSEGASERHESGKALCKQTKARVNRKFTETHKLYFNNIIIDRKSGLRGIIIAGGRPDKREEEIIE